MSVAATIGSMSAGHCFFPRPTIQGSANVLIGGLPAHTIGMKWTIHFCGKKFHPSFTAMGSPNVLVNGKPVSTFGSIDTCGHTRGMGSTDVIIGVS
jgi:uncharacterized Zn-binding protein involved in type VI secretion